jgi:hypothetical protein
LNGNGSIADNFASLRKTYSAAFSGIIDQGDIENDSTWVSKKTFQFP